MAIFTHRIFSRFLKLHLGDKSREDPVERDADLVELELDLKVGLARRGQAEEAALALEHPCTVFNLQVLGPCC